MSASTAAHRRQPAETTRFDLHTAVTEGAGGRLRAEVDPELSGFGGTHGGYLAAIALRALTAAANAGDRGPRSLTIELLAPVAPGPIELTPRLERAGSSMSFASLRITQDGSVVGTATAAFGDARRSPEYLGLEPPGVPPPEQCEPIAERPVAEARAGMLVEHRPAADPMPLSGGEVASLVAWVRLAEDRPIDVLLASMLADAMPPGLYGWLDRYIAMPSAEISIHFGDVAAAAGSPWVLAEVRTRHASGGYAIEDGELWTPEGKLLLVSRQLRRILDRG